MAFTFCLNTSTIKPQPLMRKIELAAEAGFKGVELWINDIYDFIGRGGEIRDLEEALANHGLIVPSVIAIRQWGDMEGWSINWCSTRHIGALPSGPASGPP